MNFNAVVLKFDKMTSQINSQKPCQVRFMDRMAYFGKKTIKIGDFLAEKQSKTNVYN